MASTESSSNIKTRACRTLKKSSRASTSTSQNSGNSAWKTLGVLDGHAELEVHKGEVELPKFLNDEEKPAQASTEPSDSSIGAQVADVVDEEALCMSHVLHV